MPLEMLVSKRSRKLRRYTDRFLEMEEEGEPEGEPDAPRSAAACVSYAARAASAKSACAAAAAAARRPRERRRDKTASSRDGDDARVTWSDEDAARDRVRRAGSRAERADDETRRARRGARSEVAVDAIASIVGVTRSRTGCARRSETLLTWRLARPALEFFTNNRFAFCSTRPSHLRAPNSRVRGVSFAAMSTVATRAALVVPAARGASGGRARSSGVSRPRRRTAARRRPDCASSATRPSAASASLDDGEDDDEGNPTTDVTSPSRSADGKQPVPSPTSRLSNVCFVLCRPQGPANVGGIARVMNNFGITDLRVVAPEPGALAPPFDALMDDGSDRAIHSAKDRSTAPFADEARIMAVHAAHLLRDAGRFETADAAVADCVFVAATTARPRENLPIVSVRDACASASRASVSQNASKNANSSLSLTDATNDGKVAILFGNEATGLTNEELSLANVGVMIPTASFGVPDQSEGKKNESEGKKKKTKRYTGGVGPTSLNLSHAVGVCAYEVHQAMGDTLVSGFNSRLITAEERVRLADELHKARRALDVLRTPETRDATNDDGTSSDPRTTDASGTSGTTTDVERLEHARERRAIANVLNAGPIASRDAAALFALARRVAVASSFSGTDAAVLAAARAFFLTEKTEKTDGGRAAVVKALIKAVREACGVSMTAREAERVIEALGKPEEGPGETSAKREGSTSSTDSTDR